MLKAISCLSLHAYCWLGDAALIYTNSLHFSPTTEGVTPTVVIGAILLAGAIILLLLAKPNDDVIVCDILIRLCIYM